MRTVLAALVLVTFVACADSRGPTAPTSSPQPDPLAAVTQPGPPPPPLPPPPPPPGIVHDATLTSPVQSPVQLGAVVPVNWTIQPTDGAVVTLRMASEPVRVQSFLPAPQGSITILVYQKEKLTLRVEWPDAPAVERTLEFDVR